VSEATPAIEVHALHKRYGDFEAVRGIDISVRRGEVFGLLGPNGAGKTTTVEILEGYRARSGGEVSVLGYDPGKRSRALRQRIGIVLQSGGIYGHVTPREALRYWAGFYPRPRDVEEVLSLAGLQDKADVRSRRLSGGQLRRLDFALALVGDPELIFLDEPTTGFDPAARRNAWSAIRAMCELGKTVFLTTHFMDEAQHLADRVAVMRDGEIVAEGRPDELGGRDRRPAEIHFTLPAGIALHEIPELPCELCALDGDRALVLTREPVRAAHAVTGWALERGITLGSLSIAQPTLEDIYLELTGPTPGAVEPEPTPEEVLV
jgi:ABC-2 type transport system ATP-binding protein